MIKIFNWFNNLLKNNTNASSKRFVALYIVLFLITYVVFRYTDKSNIEVVLIELLGATTVLMGVASWENVKVKTTKEKKDEKSM